VIGSEKIYSRLPDSDSALSYEVSAVIDPVIVPQLVSRPRIQSPHMIRNRDVEHSVDQQRSAFDYRSWRTALRSNFRDLEDPSLRKLPHIALPNLRKSTVALAAVIAVERSPIRNWRFPNHVRIEPDMRNSKRRTCNHSVRPNGQFHFRVAR